MACSNCKKIKHDLKVARRATGNNRHQTSVSDDASVDARYFEQERDKALAALAKLATSTVDFLAVQQSLLEALQQQRDSTTLAARVASKSTFLARYIDETLNASGITSAELVGMPYSAGLRVEVINLDDFEPTDNLVIDEVLRPLLLFSPTTADAPQRLLQMGRVTVKKEEA